MFAVGKQQEYVETWGERKTIAVINYYNLCRKLDINKLEEIEGQDNNNIV